MKQCSSLEKYLSDIIETGACTENLFSEMTKLIFSYQYKNNTSYRNYCNSLGKNPTNTIGWEDVPAVSTELFKIHQHPLISFPKNRIKHSFFTSGTTAEIKGRHDFPNLELYEKSIRSAWKGLNKIEVQKVIIFTAHPRDTPTSSLSHMMGTLVKKHKWTAYWAINPDGKIDQKAVDIIRKSNEPIALLGTALAFLLFFESLQAPILLPAGSWAMETGGYKGVRKEIDKEKLYAYFEKNLGLPAEVIINEYSMTEISSQFYSRGIGSEHRGPPWTRVRVIDPTSGKPTLPGQAGYLVIYDLANLHSVMAVATQDIALTSPNEKNRNFILLGRDPGALPRGCSRSAGNENAS